MKWVCAKGHEHKQEGVGKFMPLYCPDCHAGWKVAKAETPAEERMLAIWKEANNRRRKEQP